MGSLEVLKSFSGKLAGWAPKERRSFDWLPGGVSVGGITEVVGAGKTEFVLRFLAEHPSLHAAWVEPEVSLNPYGVLQHQVSVGKVFCIESGENHNWSVLQALRSGAFQVVISAAPVNDLMELRRLQLAVERSAAILFLLAPEPSGLWPVSMEVTVERNQSGHFQAAHIQK